MIAQIDHLDTAELLISQYKDANNIVGLLNTDLKHANELETALFEINDAFNLETAIGAQLDVIGAIHGLERGTFSDSVYRANIRYQIQVNQGAATPELIITAIRDLYSSSAVQLIFVGNANLQIVASITLSDAQREEILAILPVGVKVTFLLQEPSPFGFFEDITALGFGKLYVGELLVADGRTLILGDGNALLIGADVSDDTDENAGSFSAVV